MSGLYRVISALVFLLFASAQLNAESFSQVVVFGQSDHVRGRSNGPVWVDYLATDLGIPIRNFAFSSASTLDVSRQVQSYLRSRERQGFAGADADALHVSIDWSYGADKTRALFGLDTEVELPGPAANIGALADVGARTFLTGRILWAIEDSPFWRRNQRARSDVREAEEQFLADLSTLTDSKEIQVYHADLNVLAERVMRNPSAFGLLNFTDELPTSPVADPDAYVWMPDGRHLTTAYHRIIADEVLAVLAVPEPTTLSLLASAIGVWSLVLIARVRHSSRGLHS